jgi:uncharacterized membrane protein (UPF0136 family)
MTGSSHIALTSGVIVSCTGLYGYARTKSIPSAIGGLVLGSTFLGATHVLRKTDSMVVGHSLAGLAGLTALFIGANRIRSSVASAASRPGIRVGPVALVLVGLMNVPYQFIKAYEWST